MTIAEETAEAEGVVARKQKILVVRPDRIGDVVLSTPVLEAIKHESPDSEIHMLVRDVVAPVVAHNPFVSKLFVYSPEASHAGLAGFFRLVRQLREERYDVAVTLQARFAVSLAIFLAGVRYRVGPYSKWFSYFCFNRGARQSRSSVEMHEADYNLMLLRKLGIRVPSRRFEPAITVDADAKERMRAFVRGLGLADDTAFVAVHPGMGGSALNWPEGYYVDLIARLTNRGTPVIVTGGVHERTLVARVASFAREQSKAMAARRAPADSGGAGAPIHEFVGVNSPSGLADLTALLSLASVVVAPSTGPLHIAAALGKRTVSFFSPIRVQSALRWGPYAAPENDGRHTTLVPDALCGQDFKCAGRKCRFYFCMERLGVDEALGAVLAQLEAGSERKRTS